MISTRKDHLTTPDVLRAAAVLMVLSYHLFFVLFGAFLPWNAWFRDFAHPPTPYYVYLYPFTLGWSGVALFFVLSGFCIHISFLKSTNFTWRRFYWQRLWRIYPAYLVALGCFLFLDTTYVNAWFGIKDFALHLLLFHNLTYSHFLAINPSFWSLATEAQLYLLFPMLIFLRRKWGIEGALAATFAVGMAWRIFAVAKWGLPDHVITPALTSPFMTWFDWTLGAFVAERLTQQRRAFSHRAIWLCCLIPAFIGSTFYKPLTAFSFSLAATLFAVVLDIMLKIQWRKSVLLDAVVFIGTISYSIYLWHQPLLFSFAPHVWSPFGLPIVSLAVIFIISAMSWALIERNGIKLGKALLKLPSISRLFSKQNDIILPQPE